MKDTLFPAYQPIVDLLTMKPSHYEALARLRTAPFSGGHGLLINLAEAHDFVHQVDMAMMELVMREMDQHALTVAINVSPFSIQEHFGVMQTFLLEHCYMLPRVIVEITETSPIFDVAKIREFMAVVRNEGGRIAFDDFGNGKGCFSEELVCALEPDFLKLDGAVLERGLFLGDMGELAHACEMVASFGGELIAEFVDSEHKFTLLKETGVRYAQGAYFGMPSLQIAKASGVVPIFSNREVNHA